MSKGAAVGIRFVIIAAILFAAQDGISKHLAESYPIPLVVMIRYWFFALFVIALASRQPGGVRQASKTAMPIIQIVRGVLLPLQIMVIVTSFDLIGLGATHSIFAAHPLLATLLAIPVLGEHVGWRRLAAVGVGFLGVLVIMRPGTEVFDPGILVALAAAVMFALYGVLTRMVAREDRSSFPAFYYTGVAGVVAMSLIGPFFWEVMTWPDYGWMALLCVTGMSGHYCLIRALDATEAVRVQPFIYLQMVFALVIGWLIFNEEIDFFGVIGMGMIIGAGLYAIWREWLAMRAARREAGTPGAG